MKANRLSLCWVTLFFTFSCESVNDLQPQTDATVPASVVQAVSSAYPQAKELSFVKLDGGTLWESRFEVTKDQMNALVSANTGLISAYRLTRREQLPAAALLYLEMNHAKAAIREVAEEKKGQQVDGYRVRLAEKSQELALYFNADGKKTLDANPNTTEFRSYSVDKANLPVGVQQYLTTNHPGYMFEKAALLVTTAGNYYHIMFRTDDARYDISIKEDGQLMKSHKEVIRSNNTVTKELNRSELPAAIVDYTTKMYPGWEYVKGAMQTTNGVPANYYIQIIAGGKTYYLYFDGEGKFGSVKNG